MSIWVKRSQTCGAGLILTLLLFTILAGTGEHAHSQLLKLGHYLWPDYSTLRNGTITTACQDDFNIDKRLDSLEMSFNEEQQEFNLLAETFNREDARRSLENQHWLCQQQQQAATLKEQSHSPLLTAFHIFEKGFSSLSLLAINYKHWTLTLVLLMAAIIATIHQHHIAFRAISTRQDNLVSSSLQFLGNACVAISCFSYLQNNLAIEMSSIDNELLIALCAGFTFLAGINVFQIITKCTPMTKSGSWSKALLSTPIYTFMILGSAHHFFWVTGQVSGLAIYITQIYQLSGLYLTIGIYIWVGMLLKQSHIGEHLFGILKPWKLPPEYLAVIAIALMALPTAYTGASGIIVIAMGTVIYQELRRAGSRRQLALAVTAMTGSSGVVLRPCLLVIGIATLNKEVVTDELFYWGGRVFVLTLLVFLFYAVITKQKPNNRSYLSDAWPDCIIAIRQFAPYITIFALLTVLYHVVLNAQLDEFSAPIMLPMILIAIIFYEGKQSLRNKSLPVSTKNMIKTSSKIFNSVDGASVHIGALLLLMACSYAVGGVFENQSTTLESTSMLNGPTSSLFTIMSLFVITLVVIGMLMDPFGALVLVSGTLAPLAYQQGINPIHFWMTCLVAFELGYLSPPVSLNHLLTRQVVGEQEFILSKREGDTFYYRHERILLPLLVMGTTLILVAYAPLLFEV